MPLVLRYRKKMWKLYGNSGGQWAEGVERSAGCRGRGAECRGRRAERGEGRLEKGDRKPERGDRKSQLDLQNLKSYR